MYPSLDRLCSDVSAKFFHLSGSSFSYHQKVCLGVFPVRALHENTARAQVAGKRHAQVRIVENTKVIRLCRVGGANLAWLDFQFGLAKAAALDEDLIYISRDVSPRSGNVRRIECVDVRLGARSSASIGFLSSGSSLSTAIVIKLLRD